MAFGGINNSISSFPSQAERLRILQEALLPLYMKGLSVILVQRKGQSSQPLRDPTIDDVTYLLFAVTIFILILGIREDFANYREHYWSLSIFFIYTI